ncbi:MAG TPA: hypothetical protein DDX39_02765 [Bacteroidales bacterium]|nr:MAG: hypothetical protein A2W98_05295 [Bacteroidetes bacterium GWF2_33_38]HBF87539.1 hypothetical protein [Bacteroidales bacterium]
MTTKIGILIIFMLFATSYLFAQTNTERQTKEKFDPNQKVEMEPIHVERQATNTEITEEVLLPDGFPVYVNTGNKEKDVNEYNVAKEKWISDHPEEYKKLQEKEASIKIRISKREYDSLPAYKKTDIEQDKDRYIIE